MITDIVIVHGKILDHDPMETKLLFDDRFQGWKCPSRHSMNFIKPKIIESYEYDYIHASYILINVSKTNQYYRPVEFYDHFYSPEQINKLNDSTIKEYINYYTKRNCFFEAKIYKKFLQIKDKNILKCIQSLITEKGYRIMTDVHENQEYIKRSITFDETWNTIFYYHLLLPKRKLHFINIKEFTCTCCKTCVYTKCMILRLLVCNYLKNNIDIYLLIKDLILQNV